MELYWALVLVNLKPVLVALAVVLGMASALSAVLGGGCDDGLDNTSLYCFRTALVLIILSVILGLGSGFCLTRTDLAIMYAWDGMKSDSVQEVIEILKDMIRG